MKQTTRFVHNSDVWVFPILSLFFAWTPYEMRSPRFEHAICISRELGARCNACCFLWWTKMHNSSFVELMEFVYQSFTLERRSNLIDFPLIQFHFISLTRDNRFSNKLTPSVNHPMARSIRNYARICSLRMHSNIHWIQMDSIQLSCSVQLCTQNCTEKFNSRTIAMLAGVDVSRSKYWPFGIFPYRLRTKNACVCGKQWTKNVLCQSIFHINLYRIGAVWVVRNICAFNFSLKFRKNKQLNACIFPHMFEFTFR